MPVRSQAQRVVVILLCALLFVPLLAAVPVYASSYVDLGFPPLPEWDRDAYPFAFILKSTDGTFYLWVCSNRCLGTGSAPDGKVYFNSVGKGVLYVLSGNSWIYQSLKNPSIGPQYLFVWAEFDIYTSSGDLWYEADSSEPTVPTLTTSFDGQVISFDAGSLRFFITATNVNGTLSCQWYVNGAPISGEWTFIEAEPGVWLQGWVYTPIENGTREMYCIVTNTVGGKSESVSTGTVIVHYGVSGGGGGGSGDLSQVTDKLDVLDMDISELKNSVQAVQDSVDALPDKITDGIQDIVDQENENAESEGNKFVDQITGLVPNDSQGFIDSMGSLVNVLSYDGTDCVLTIPALTIPAIEPHFSEFTVLDAQQLDFEEYINMMPPNLLLLIRSLLTGALIVYCFKELYGVISYFFVLKGGET